MSWKLIATTAFGLEAVVERELHNLGYRETRIEDGRVWFTGNALAVCRANIWLRSADRVLIAVGEFPAQNFDELFDSTKALPWEEWLSADAAFPVTGRSVQSRLHGVPVCQKMVKRAIVERLKTKYQRAWYRETGPEYLVDFIMLRDQCLLTLDTTGDGLHRRGYRTIPGPAPLKETMAAALVQLSFWNQDRQLVDPCCGSGTIPIEAAMIARNIAPGGSRNFIAEAWPQIPLETWNEARKEARDVKIKPLPFRILGSDIDRRAIDQARKNAFDAGVRDDVNFERMDFVDFHTTRDYGVVITNPPYGERIGDRDEVDKLNRQLREWLDVYPTWSMYVLSGHPAFERLFGRPADRRRKLYNGRIQCTYFQYLGPRPPRAGAELAPAGTTLPEAVNSAPVLRSPVLESPVLESPVLESPVLESPVLEQPDNESPLVDLQQQPALRQDEPVAVETPLSVEPTQLTEHHTLVADSELADSSQLIKDPLAWAGRSAAAATTDH